MSSLSTVHGCFYIVVIVAVVEIIKCTLVQWGTFQQLEAGQCHLLTTVQVVFQCSMFINVSQSRKECVFMRCANC